MTRQEAVDKVLKESEKRKLYDRLYNLLDEYLKRLKKKVKETFAPLYVAGFDQLNIIQLNEKSEAMYKKLDAFNRKNYEELVEHARGWAAWVLGKKIPDVDVEKIVNEFLKGYDAITQYVYEKEIDRKRMRMNEAILTAREFQDIVKLHKAVKKAADLWYTQSSQYGVDILEFAYMKVFEEDDDTSYYRWVTVGDEKVCETCHDRDGKIYPEDALPSRPHYGCRCMKIPAFNAVDDSKDLRDDE